jgi:hypothetical protein
MLVTNRDTYIASYSIKSYQKIIPVLTNYDWKLVVYLNCIKDEFKKKYVSEWKRYPFVEIVDNAQFVNADELIPGSAVISDDGCKSALEGKFERGCAVWTREFRKFNSDYWATVDADFELLSADFVVEAFKILENKNIVAVSADFSDNHHGYDSYSNENIVFMKRYNTWFCIYKKEAQKCNTSHFYYQEIVHGLRLAFDDGAKLQCDLREKFGYEMCAVDKKYSYIHYGAFSKNNSLDTPSKIKLYRKITILSHKGLFGNKFIFDKIIRRCFKIIHNRLYKKIRKERGKLIYHSKLDE